MAFEDIYDIQMSEDGDLVIIDSDLALVNGVAWFIQEVSKIVKTNNPTWALHPNVGANVEDFAGQPNTREVARSIEKQVREAVTAEHIEMPGTIRVKAVPTSADSIVVYINLDVDGLTHSVSKVIFNYSNGLVSPYPIDRDSITPQGGNPKLTGTKNPYFSRI